MRDQLPLRNVPADVPVEPLGFTGCVTRQNADAFTKEFTEGNPSPAQPSFDDPFIHPSTSPPSNGHRTYPNENGGGGANGSLKINDLQKPDPNGRSVDHSKS